MKKIIALLLALIMTFSVATVAFATEGEVAPAPDAPAVEEEAPSNIAESLEGMLGEYAWILDLPFETVGPALWFAKMAVKIVIAYIGFCNKLGLDPAETAQKLFDFAASLVEKYKPVENPEAAPEVAPAA